MGSGRWESGLASPQARSGGHRRPEIFRDFPAALVTITAIGFLKSI